jgi:hypothetical protein
MTTLLVATAAFLGGAMLVAAPHPGVRATGVVMAATGAFLWFGLSVLCGPGPLMHCSVLQ